MWNAVDLQLLVEEARQSEEALKLVHPRAGWRSKQDRRSGWVLALTAKKTKGSLKPKQLDQVLGTLTDCLCD